MMQCSSAATQIQYSRRRIFFGFEDEIAGAEVVLHTVLTRLETPDEVALGYQFDLLRLNQ
jgi:hypothetical protein